MAMRVASAAALLTGFVLVPLTAATAAPAPTADQQLVADLQDARTASRTALRNLANPTLSRTTKARADLLRALAALDAAANVLSRTVGALETPSIRAGVIKAAGLERRARADIDHERYSSARARITAALALKTSALADFGVPLAKDFSVFAVNQSLKNVQGFENYSAVTATVGTSVTEIVIGGANRTTANAGEPGGSTASVGEQLPITKLSIYTMTEPNGAFEGGWCSLEDNLITCALARPMRADQRFTVAFGPKQPRGTKMLVKFRTGTGKRSYAVVATR